MRIKHTEWQKVRFIPFLWHRVTWAEQETMPVTFEAWTDLRFSFWKPEGI